MTSAPSRTSLPVADIATRTDVLRRLELQVLRRLDGRASGDNATVVNGPGSERAGARAYEPGDDARLIDWNLTARSAQTFVRQTEAEREVETWIVTDRSASLDFGTANSEKRDVVLAATAAFGMLKLGGSNRIGVVIAGTDKLAHRPARQGRTAFMAALAAVHDTPRQEGTPESGAGLARACRWLLGAARQRCQIIVVSDFLDTDQWERELRLLAIRHEVVAVHVTDPREFELPAVGILAVVDAETGRQRYVNTTASMRQKYSTAATLRHQGITSAIRGSGAEYLHLSTDRDAISDTVHFTTHRRARRAASSHTGLVLR